MIPSSISGDIEVPASVDAQGNVHIGHQIVHNYYASADWQKLQQRLADALENYQSFPEHPKFAEQLQKVQDEIESFKRDVVKLAQDFQKIPLNTERLKQAKVYFDQGDYSAARAVLNTEMLSQEQDSLLAQQAVLNEQLAANADEFMLLARLTAMNFDLGEERIPKTCEAFESALKSKRTLEHLFEYAYYLSIENRVIKSQNIYEEILRLYQSPNSQDLEIYIYNLARALNNLANLLILDVTKCTQAEKMYRKSLYLLKVLTSSKTKNYVVDTAGTLINLGLLLDSTRKKGNQSIHFYREALSIYTSLGNQSLNEDSIRLRNIFTTIVESKNTRKSFLEGQGIFYGMPVSIGILVESTTISTIKRYIIRPISYYDAVESYNQTLLFLEPIARHVSLLLLDACKQTS